jgi:hypothetical protein
MLSPIIFSWLRLLALTQLPLLPSGGVQLPVGMLAAPDEPAIAYPHKEPEVTGNDVATNATNANAQALVHSTRSLLQPIQVQLQVLSASAPALLPPVQRHVHHYNYQEDVAGIKQLPNPRHYLLVPDAATPAFVGHPQTSSLATTNSNPAGHLVLPQSTIAPTTENLLAPTRQSSFAIPAISLQNYTQPAPETLIAATHAAPISSLASSSSLINHNIAVANATNWLAGNTEISDAYYETYRSASEQNAHQTHYNTRHQSRTEGSNYTTNSQQGREVYIHLHRGMIEQLNLHGNQQQDGLTDLRDKVEQILLDILNHANQH